MATNLACLRLPKLCGTTEIIEYNKFPTVNMTEQVMATGRMEPSLSASHPNTGANNNCAKASVATTNPYWNIVTLLSS